MHIIVDENMDVKKMDTLQDVAEYYYTEIRKGLRDQWSSFNISDRIFNIDSAKPENVTEAVENRVRVWLNDDDMQDDYERGQA